LPALIDGIRLKIHRANKHLDDLQFELSQFFATDPYAFRIESDPQTGEHVCYLSRCDDIPSSIPVIAGDVIHNLRSALDYLAYQLVKIGTHSRGPFVGIYFPIVDDPSELEPAIKRKVKGAREEAKNAIRNVKPYKGGSTLLWQLHKLNIIDKHRLLVAASSSGFRNATPQDLERLRKLWAESRGSTPDLAPIGGLEWIALNKFPLKTGYELIRGRSEAEVNQYHTFHCFPAFSEPGIIERLSILGTLESMSKLVDDTVSNFAPLLI
jgi:hypothetical protein